MIGSAVNDAFDLALPILYPCTEQENTHLYNKGKFHCMAYLLLYLFGIHCFIRVELVTDLLAWSNPYLSNRRSTVLWYFLLQLNKNPLTKYFWHKFMLYLFCSLWLEKCGKNLNQSLYSSSEFKFSGAYTLSNNSLELRLRLAH